MAKKIAKTVKVVAPAGAATPAPPLGPTLGQAGINIGQFVTEFNAKTAELPKGEMTPAVITVYEDRSFTFILKTPPASFLLKRAAGADKGSGAPNTKKVGKVTKQQVREIAQKKMADLNAADENAAMKIIEGTARSMGIEVK